MDKFREIIKKQWPSQDFDHLGLAIFNLKEGSFETLSFHDGVEKEIPDFYYDLASLTKILTMGALALKEPKLFEGSKRLLLEHRGGLPAWAILGKKSWRDTVTRFPIKESETKYSDLSMLRLMLMIEEETGKDLQDLTSFYWDSDLKFWKDLPESARCPDTGFRHKAVINAEVNDDNCFKINRFCSHAGLFGTLKGLTQSVLNLHQEVDLMKSLDCLYKEKKDRFIMGWDTVGDPSDTLAGPGCPERTVGHLGFTGTSLWFDIDSGRGWILLTNATKKYWYHRKGLHELRKSLGTMVWEGVKSEKNKN